METKLFILSILKNKNFIKAKIQKLKTQNVTNYSLRISVKNYNNWLFIYIHLPPIMLKFQKHLTCHFIKSGAQARN